MDRQSIKDCQHTFADYSIIYIQQNARTDYIQAINFYEHTRIYVRHIILFYYMTYANQRDMESESIIFEASDIEPTTIGQSEIKDKIERMNTLIRPLMETMRMIITSEKQQKSFSDLTDEELEQIKATRRHIIDTIHSWIIPPKLINPLYYVLFYPVDYNIKLNLSEHALNRLMTFIAERDKDREIISKIYTQIVFDYVFNRYLDLDAGAKVNRMIDIHGITSSEPTSGFTIHSEIIVDRKGSFPSSFDEYSCQQLVIERRRLIHSIFDYYSKRSLFPCPNATHTGGIFASGVITDGTFAGDTIAKYQDVIRHSFGLSAQATCSNIKFLRQNTITDPYCTSIQWVRFTFTYSC